MADGRPLQEGQVLTGPLFNEPIRVETVRPSGPDMWIAGLVGIHLDQWEGRIIATEKGIIRLLPIAERAKQLFGEDGAAAVADRIEAQPTGPV